MLENKVLTKIAKIISDLNLVIPGVFSLRKSVIVNWVLLFLCSSILLTACAGGNNGDDIQEKVATTGELVPYHSKMMGIRSILPSEWVQFYPIGTFVRAMP